MGLKVGIIGLPNVGKSTLFNALSGMSVAAENYPFCTIEPNTAVVEIVDSFLDTLYSITKSSKKVNPTLDIVDIAGLVKGASQGEGLGNQFLSHVANCDLLLHVVRSFKDENVMNSGYGDLVKDIELINMELRYKDLEIIEKRINKIERKARTGDKALKKELEKLEAAKNILEDNNSLFLFNQEKLQNLENVQLLSAIPQMVILNIAEDEIQGIDKKIAMLKEKFSNNDIAVHIVPAKFEYDLGGLDAEEQAMFRAEYGIEQKSLDVILRSAYKLLDLITFYTYNENETKAWSIGRGKRLIDAAYKIHSDIGDGFIKAEVVKKDDFMKLRDFHKLREAGLIHIEGKDSAVEDGDIIYIHFKK